LFYSLFEIEYGTPVSNHSIKHSLNRAQHVGLADQVKWPVLICGIGSPHGNDAAGWLAIDALKLPAVTGRIQHDVFYCKAAVPHKMLDWLDGTGVHGIETHEIAALHIIDAAITGEQHVRQLKLQLTEEYQIRLWDESGTPLASTSELLAKLQSRSTHQLDIFSVLQLAGVLGKLPDQIYLWLIPVLESATSPGQLVTVYSAIAECAERIHKALPRA
jgi:hypothetical protein